MEGFIEYTEKKSLESKVCYSVNSFRCLSTDDSLEELCREHLKEN